MDGLNSILNLDGVRAVVDARLAELAKRRAKRRAKIMRSMSFSYEERETTPLASCEFEVAGFSPDVSDESCSLEHPEAMPYPLSRGSGKCAPRCQFSSMEHHRPSSVVDGMDVPSVEPRPPNLNAVNLSFAARLVIAVRDRFKGDAPKVYRAAKVSRQVYSQIVSDETRPVSKRTAVRFAFALKSTPEEARLLLKSAGFAFSNSQAEDFILQACLENNPPVWDLKAVNMLLKEYRVDFQY